MSLQATVIPAADDAYNQRPSVHSCVPVAHTFTQVLPHSLHNPLPKPSWVWLVIVR